MPPRKARTVAAASTKPAPVTDSTAESPAVTPRKRGRPPKSEAAKLASIPQSPTASPATTPRRRGRPPKSEAAKAAAQQTTAKAKRIPAAESDSDIHTTTPTRRSSAGSKKSQLAPPDTLGLTRRKRSTATASSPVASSSKPAAAKKPRGRPRAKPVAVTEVADESGDDGDDGGGGDKEAEAEFADTIRGASPYEYDSPNEMVILDTPSKKVTTASPLLFTRTRPPPKVGFAQDVDNSSPVPKRGRKRKSDADELPSPPAKHSDDVQRPPPAKRGRPRKSQLPEPEPDQEDESEAESGDQQIPVRPPARIRAAPVVVSPRHEVFVDIVSPSKFERSRARIASTKQTESQPAASAPKDESAKWRKKYEDLCALRQSQPEKEYAELQKSSQERFDAADALIAKLRSEITEITRKAGAGQKKAAATQATTNGAGAASHHAKSASEKELEKQVVILQQQIEALTQDVLSKDEAIERLEKHRKLIETSTDYNLRESLKLMQEMSGLTIEDVVPEDDGLSYLCKQTGPNATVSYKLTVSDEYPSEFQYAPTDSARVPDALPEYLQDSISFEKSSATMFYWRMCDHLHQHHHEDSTTEQTDAAAAAAAVSAV
ncbi:hypothetical protein GGF42_003788 [Coemansia sp. RSA 2424]|nr:hypothetical protein GGF42_003788 [Coemansia sp. RSA 2424]